MGHTMIAYDESQDSGAAFVAVAPLVDQSVTTQGDSVLVPSDEKFLAMVMAMGPNIVRAQVQAPSLRKESLIDVPFVEVAAVPTQNPRYLDMRKNARELVPGEGLQAFIEEDVGGAERETVLMILSDGEMEPVEGVLEWIELTATTTLVVHVWTLVVAVITQQLRAGRYAIVSMRAISANGQAARLVIAGQSSRPGVIMHDDIDQEALEIFEPDEMGNWGEFEHTYIPQFEMLANVADTAERIYLGIKMVRSGAPPQ